jgi:hypothetical protein
MTQGPLSHSHSLLMLPGKLQVISENVGLSNENIGENPT